jgi:Na+-transporting methylmalonyl-CoA/oxaloacetate decarboxylase gamma subunit
VIAQPKAGLAKSILFTAIGFLVVAAVLWIIVVVVRGMK